MKVFYRSTAFNRIFLLNSLNLGQPATVSGLYSYVGAARTYAVFEMGGMWLLSKSVVYFSAHAAYFYPLSCADMLKFSKVHFSMDMQQGPYEKSQTVMRLLLYLQKVLIIKKMNSNICYSFVYL